MKGRLPWLWLLVWIAVVACSRPEAREAGLEQALIAAAAAGDTGQVTALLLRGAPLNGQDAQGRTAVMAATHANQIDVVRVLLNAGADVNIQDNRRDNPFLYAGASGSLEILHLAHAAGADPTLTNRFGGTALIPAAERGHVEVVRFLLSETKVDVNHVNNLGWTALLEAIILSDGGSRHQQIVDLLIAAGAQVNQGDGDGIRPLRHARQRGQQEIAARLLAAGARE